MPALAPKERKIRTPDKPVQFDKKQITLKDAEVDSLIRVLKARQSFSVSGSGLTVAVLDTGLRTTHVDFKDKVPARQNFTQDDGGSPSVVTDVNGHGTNVAGIIVANGIHVGIAPGAGVVPLKVLDNSGGGSFEAVAKALDWVLVNHDAHGISVVSMSLGDESNDADDGALSADPVRDKIVKLRALNIPVVVAAGNDYFKFQAEGMGYPAILRETVSVGAVYDANEGGFRYQSGAQAFSSGPDRLTPFSQRLHESTALETRTEIFAPGAPVTSSGNQSDEGESVDHGTSQACPVVSGAILLLQEFHKKTTKELPSVDLLIECLRAGGVKVVDGDDEDDNVRHTRKTYLRVDAFLALDAMRRRLQKQLMLTRRAFV